MNCMQGVTLSEVDYESASEREDSASASEKHAQLHAALEKFCQSEENLTGQWIEILNTFFKHLSDQEPAESGCESERQAQLQAAREKYWQSEATEENLTHQLGEITNTFFKGLGDHASEPDSAGTKSDSDSEFETTLHLSNSEESQLRMHGTHWPECNLKLENTGSQLSRMSYHLNCSSQQERSRMGCPPSSHKESKRIRSGEKKALSPPLMLTDKSN